MPFIDTLQLFGMFVIFLGLGLLLYAFLLAILFRSRLFFPELGASFEAEPQKGSERLPL